MKYPYERRKSFKLKRKIENWEIHNVVPWNTNGVLGYKHYFVIVISCNPQLELRKQDNFLW